MSAVVKTIVFLAVLGACSPTYRLVQHVRDAPRPQTCPTLTMLLGDFVLSSTAFAISALKYNGRNYTETGAYAGIGLGVAIGANLAETTCR